MYRTHDDDPAGKGHVAAMRPGGSRRPSAPQAGRGADVGAGVCRRRPRMDRSS